MIVGTLSAPWPHLILPLRVLGILPLATGLVLNVRHARLFDKIGTNIKTFNEPQTFVTSGAYRWTRNPMYLGFVMILVGAATLLGAVVAMAGPVIFFIAAERCYIPFEEARMTAAFGADYDRYQRQVPRWAGAWRTP